MADCVILAYALIEEINLCTSLNSQPIVVRDLFDRAIRLSREFDLYIKSVMSESNMQVEATNLLMLQSQLIRKISSLNRHWRRELSDKRFSA